MNKWINFPKIKLVSDGAKIWCQALSNTLNHYTRTDTGGTEKVLLLNYTVFQMQTSRGLNVLMRNLTAISVHSFPPIIYGRSHPH